MASIVRHLTQVNATIPALNRAGKSCRVFLSRVMTDEARLENPKCKFNVKIVDDVQQTPTLRVVFRDGKDIQLATDKMKPSDILEVVGKHARKLQEKADAMND
ncbi:hypothetical protein SYNPS1DRAFT_26410 [Syncephalis pseudoplumigaleata]|uniref:Large ribosomal subunit protein mL53 n=1 Tax=Syncephalis pseudoplumigaleata TaxID=1712513 RepID=A0A4P9Z8A3_9FUNG|nr:hypothetical protein SYNPS1DRAFT_26410 [Syncephalis pseudoplumigaleata]|eukprot:RKP27980.1 hypothetical protein SYNPS1DRAFT_26410 [Syncephalis pseudoplumigaleata]